MNEGANDHPRPCVGMPASLFLHQFGAVICGYFGKYAFQVGSSLHPGNWRDVDIRLILEDDEFDAMFPDLHDGHEFMHPRWMALTAAFSALGEKMTGLPIDFQIQRMTQANEKYPSLGNKGRYAIGFVPGTTRVAVGA